jgi:hypothetical protein
MTRSMIVAGQNETVRKRPEDNVYLATIGLNGCIALIIADEFGSVSLTHIDTETDLSFIGDELNLMKGNLQFYLIKRTGKGDLSPLVSAAISCLAIDKSTYTLHPVKDSDEGTVIFSLTKKVPQFFTMKDFAELTSPGVIASTDNKLVSLGYTATLSVDDPQDYQRRIYVRQLNAVFGPKSKPLVVFDEGVRQDTSLDLAADAERYIQNSGTELRFFSLGKQQSIAHVIPRYQQLMEQIKLNTSPQPH